MSLHIATNEISTFVCEHMIHLLETCWRGTPVVLKKDQFGLHDAGLLTHILRGEIVLRCPRTAVTLP